MSEITGEVKPEDIQSPERLREFLKLLDKQVAEGIASVEGDDASKVTLAASVRARGLHWALARAADIMAAQAARITELERLMRGDGK